MFITVFSSITVNNASLNYTSTNKGCHSQSDQTIWTMTARRCGIRDICAITGYSRDKVQAALKRSPHQIIPKQKHYDIL